MLNPNEISESGAEKSENSEKSAKNDKKKPVSEREWVLKLEKSALKANRVVREPQKSIPVWTPSLARVFGGGRQTAEGDAKSKVNRRLGQRPI